MKKITILFALTICFNLNAQLVEIVPDSIWSSFTMVNKGLTQVLKNGNFHSQHQRKDKADGEAYTLTVNNPLDSIDVIQPKSIPEVKFKIFVDQSKLNTLDSTFYNKLEQLKIADELQALAIQDLYTNMLPGIDKRIDQLDSIYTVKLNILQNRINTLQSFIRDSIAFAPVEPRDTIDYSLPLLKGFVYDTTGWQIDSANDSYTYLNETENRYIVFDFNRDMIVGETYRIYFQIVIADQTSQANFDIWLYESSRETYPVGWVSPKVSDILGYTHSSSARHYFDYTVEYLDRHRLGIRAKISDMPFTIKNIEIVKL